MRSINM